MTSPSAHDLARLPLANRVTTLRAELVQAEKARDWIKAGKLCGLLDDYERELLAVDQIARRQRVALRGL